MANASARNSRGYSSPLYAVIRTRCCSRCCSGIGRRRMANTAGLSCQLRSIRGLHFTVVGAGAVEAETILIEAKPMIGEYLSRGSTRSERLGGHSRLSSSCCETDTPNDEDADPPPVAGQCGNANRFFVDRRRPPVGLSIAPRRVRDPRLSTAVGVHDVDLGISAPGLVSCAVEDDLGSIRRERRRGVVLGFSSA